MSNEMSVSSESYIPIWIREDNFQSLLKVNAARRDAFPDDDEHAIHPRSITNQYGLPNHVLKFFTYGNCLYFAEVLQEKIGGKIIVEARPVNEGLRLSHCHVLKNGWYFDAHGAKTKDEVLFSMNTYDSTYNVMGERALGLAPIAKVNLDIGRKRLIYINGEVSAGKMAGEKGRSEAEKWVTWILQNNGKVGEKYVRRA